MIGLNLRSNLIDVFSKVCVLLLQVFYVFPKCLNDVLTLILNIGIVGRHYSWNKYIGFESVQKCWSKEILIPAYLYPHT